MKSPHNSLQNFLLDNLRAVLLLFRQNLIKFRSHSILFLIVAAELFHLILQQRLNLIFHIFLPENHINGIAGSSEVDYTKNNKLILPGLTVDSLDFYINNYDILSSVYGEKIDGIMGYSFLSRYIVKINYDSLSIEVYSPGSIEYPRNGYLLHPLFTALPIQPLTIKDARTINANFYIDTGAGLCFLMSKQFEE